MDLRIPSGLFFSIVGLAVAAMGAFSPGLRARLTNANVNLYCGLFMFAFGVVLLLLAWSAAKRKTQ